MPCLPLAFVGLGRGAKERRKDGSSSATCPERVVPMLHGSVLVKHAQESSYLIIRHKWMAVVDRECTVCWALARDISGLPLRKRKVGGGKNFQPHEP